MDRRGSPIVEEAQPRLPWKGRIGIFWLLLGDIGAFCGWISISYTNFAKKLVVMDVYTIHGLLIVQFTILFNLHYLFSAYVMGRNALTYLIGRSVRFAVDVVTVCIAFMMRLFLEYNKFYIYSLVSFTVNIHAFWKLRYAPGDFGIWDVLVEVFMQIVVYLSGGCLPASAVVLISCGAITLYRYFFYPAPLQPSATSPEKCLKC